MNIVLRAWQKYAPNSILILMRLLAEPKSLKANRKAVLQYFKTQDNGSLSPEILEGINYLKSHKFSPFPYKWTQKYDSLLTDVFRDEKLNQYYILFEEKSMYFPARFTESQVIWAARSIYKEQDPQSPHLYLTSDFQVDADSIVIDAGVAEGNFGLAVVDKVKRLYLIESDAEWMDSIKLTFAPWKEKVVFVEKFMSDEAGETTTSIDSLIKPDANEKYFIKMDIEGFEQKALAGMKNLASSGCPVKMNVCTYHQPNALNEIEAIVEGYGFKYQISDGYVLFFQPGEQPSFRKVLIRAEKN
jgi:hypothetical protein